MDQPGPSWRELRNRLCDGSSPRSWHVHFLHVAPDPRIQARGRDASGSVRRLRWCDSAAPAQGFLQTGFMPSTPRLGVLAMGALCRMRSCSDRFIASRRGARRRFGSLGACERLPQTVDRLGETCNLVGEPLGVSLLRGEKAPQGLQLILNDLQLVDRFLLGSFQPLGFLYELFGGLCSPNLQLAGGNDTLLLGGSACVGAPQRDRADAKQDHDECPCGEWHRLRADQRHAVGRCIPRCDFDHGTSKPAGKRRFPYLPQWQPRDPGKTALMAAQKVAASSWGRGNRIIDLPSFFASVRASPRIFHLSAGNRRDPIPHVKRREYSVSRTVR